MIGLHMGMAIDASYRDEQYEAEALGREITDLVHRGLSGPTVRRGKRVESDPPARAVTSDTPGRRSTTLPNIGAVSH